jgi:antitoxin PrlF
VRHWKPANSQARDKSRCHEVRKAIGAKSGDIIAYEIEGKIVRLKRVESVDAEFHVALADALDEWSSNADEEAFRDL